MLLPLFILLITDPNPDLLYQKADALYYSKQYEDATILYKHSANLYLQKYDTAKASLSFNDAGLCFYLIGDFDSAEILYLKSIHLEIESENQSALVGRYLNLSIVYQEWGKFFKAIEVLDKARQLALEANSYVNLAPINTSLGNLYLEQENYSQALSYFKKALLHYTNLQNEKGLALSHSNIGIAYFFLNDLDSSMSYFTRSIKEKNKLADSASLAFSYNGLGKVYQKKEQYDSSEYYFLQAYQIRAQYKEARNKAHAANELARFYLKANQNSKAKSYLDEAYTYAREANNRTLLMESLKLYGEYHKAIKAYDQAYDHLEQWSAMRDSVFNQEKIKVLEVQSEYDLARSEDEKQLAQKEAEIAQSRTQRIGWVALVLVIFLTGTIVFTWIILKQRKRLSELNSKLDAKNAQISAINKQNFHFTKNSLTEIVSMLNVQLKGIKNGQVKDVLMAEKLRMETTNLLYRQLFITPEENEIELSCLIESIVHNTIEAILGNRENIQIRFDTKKCFVTNVQALSIGMIVNEITLNACKYALMNGGQFQVLLFQENTLLNLKISDDGSGYQEENQSDTFGLKLIDALSKELEAKYSMDNHSSGLCYYFRIPIK